MSNNQTTSDRPIWYTVKQISVLYGLKVATVQYYVSRYRVPRLRLGGGLKIRKDVWENFMRSREIDADSSSTERSEDSANR